MMRLDCSMLASNKIWGSSQLEFLLRNISPTGRETILTTNTSAKEETRMANIIFREFQSSHGPISQLAVRFCLSNPSISSVIIDSAKPSHVADSISAMENSPLPRHFFENLEELYQTNFLQEI